MPNHSTSSANIVVNGTAPEDFCPQIIRFSTKKIKKKNPGYRNAVRMVVVFQRPSSPSKTLHSLEDTYPATTPMSVNKSIMDCSSPPRCAGDSSPSRAQIIVTTDMPSTCMPEPTDTDSRVEKYGLRNTSPCTNFQPVSSLASSAVATSLYCVMSRCRVLSRIMATMPDRKTRMRTELRIANQWIWPPVILRYASHLEAQRTSDQVQETS
mmetsp:Transcript_59730/g.158841  ORF Transcript_59730/g.158841 Transcript_59730/m.158841 type:complete len:210 (+) Transcript_59730:224-853(+)